MLGGAQIAIDGPNFDPTPSVNDVIFKHSGKSTTGPKQTSDDEFKSGDGTLAYTLPSLSELTGLSLAEVGEAKTY